MKGIAKHGEGKMIKKDIQTNGNYDWI